MINISSKSRNTLNNLYNSIDATSEEPVDAIYALCDVIKPLGWHFIRKLNISSLIKKVQLQTNEICLFVMREHVKIISNYTKISTHKERFSYIINKSITNCCTWILCVVFHLFLRQYQSMHEDMRTNDQHFSNKTSRNKNNEISYFAL